MLIRILKRMLVFRVLIVLFEKKVFKFISNIFSTLKTLIISTINSERKCPLFFTYLRSICKFKQK